MVLVGTPRQRVHGSWASFTAARHAGERQRWQDAEWQPQVPLHRREGGPSTQLACALMPLTFRAVENEGHSKFWQIIGWVGPASPPGERICLCTLAGSVCDPRRPRAWRQIEPLGQTPSPLSGCDIPESWKAYWPWSVARNFGDPLWAAACSQQLLVLGTEMGGRWSAGAQSLVKDLVRPGPSRPTCNPSRGVFQLGPPLVGSRSEELHTAQCWTSRPITGPAGCPCGLDTGPRVVLAENTRRKKKKIVETNRYEHTCS